MKKLIKVILVSIFTCFSFYYTDKAVQFSKKQDPLMIEINEYKEKYKSSFVNGTLTKETMLVGSSGFIIDVDKSYEKMKKLDSFNESLLEYISIKPAINKWDNLDKLIEGKNTNLKEISFVFVVNDIDLFEQIVHILRERDVFGTFFVDGLFLENNFSKLVSFSNIKFGFYGYNLKYDEISMRYIKGLFEKKISYSNYCLYINDTFFNTCQKYKINTIKPITISDNLYNFIKKEKKNGYIYQIDVNKANIKELNSTIMFLKQKGYNILSIDQLLKE